MQTFQKKFIIVLIRKDNKKYFYIGRGKYCNSLSMTTNRLDAKKFATERAARKIVAEEWFLNAIQLHNKVAGNTSFILATNIEIEFER